MIATIVQVALGGAIGATGRYLTGIATRHLFGIGFPWGTLTVNIVGSAMMGILVVVLAEKGGLRYAPFFLIGVLGGFTTFSSFSLDVITIYERGEVGVAAIYVLASVVLSIAALFGALALTRMVFA